MKRFRLKPWDLLHLLSDGTPENRKNLERIVARHDGDFSPLFERRKKEIERCMREFENKRSYLNPDITPQDFLSLINHYAELSDKLERVCAASYLKFSEDTSDTNAKKNNYDMRIFNARMNNRLLFFELWLTNGLDDDNFERIAKQAGEHERFLREERRFKPYTLDEGMEKILNSLHMLGQVERSEFYEEVISSLEFTIHEDIMVKKKGAKRKKKVSVTKTLNEPQLMPYLSSPKRKLRTEAWKELFKRYAEIKNTIGGSFIIQGTEWKSEYIDQRKYQTPMAARNHINGLDDVIVDTVLDVNRENTALFKDYFVNIKKRLAGIRSKMSLTDIYVPIKGINKKKMSFEESMNTVLDAFHTFSPDIANIIIEMERKRFLHSQPQKNKWIGTYSYPTPPATLPYTLINLTGDENDCIELVHELSHAVHNELSCQKNTVLTYTPSDPLAEIASFFGEMLMFDKFFEKAQDNPQLKKKYLVNFLDNAYMYTMKKAQLVLFEKEAHRIIHLPGFEIDDLSNLYLRKLKEQFGTEMHVPEYFQDEWLSVGNIMQNPFQDYAYPFGFLVAINLHEKYKKEGESFAPKMISFLSAGDWLIEELLKKEFGLEIRKKEFWQHGYDLVKEKVEELKKLSES
ncbi:MAG TPA: M3 family metallopeptidase [Candidatus Nanoarchaeia archaeon]|nr:M3 family metallopeptidase [Candidatus Nanoarchaeia archaeon]